MKIALFLLSFVVAAPAFAYAEVNPLAPMKTFALADGRSVVTDASDITLYTFDPDVNGESTCYDACANAWPALIVPEGTVVNAPVGLTTRKDGSLQVTLDGKPVYYFAGDGAPGDINGDGLGGVWHIIVR